MANLITKLTRSSQPVAERQPAVEQEAAFAVALNSAIEGIAHINDRIDELVASLNEQRIMLDSISASIKKMSENGVIYENNSFGNADTYYEFLEQQNDGMQNQSQKTEVFVSPIQKSSGILLVAREVPESSKAQFILDEKTGLLSYNAASFSFCVYDVEARLMPFADVTFEIKDKKANSIEQIEAGKAEKKDSSWYCSVKPKLKIV